MGLLRILVPARVRRAVHAGLDARYVSRADHRQDIRDVRDRTRAEVQALRAEVRALRDEVAKLRRRPAAPAPDPELPGKVDDARRLAQEGAAATDHLMQAEVLLWQAVDRLEARVDRLDSAPVPVPADGPEGPAGGGGAGGHEGFASCA